MMTHSTLFRAKMFVFIGAALLSLFVYEEVKASQSSVCVDNDPCYKILFSYCQGISFKDSEGNSHKLSIDTRHDCSVNKQGKCTGYCAVAPFQVTTNRSP